MHAYGGAVECTRAMGGTVGCHGAVWATLRVTHLARARFDGHQTLSMPQTHGKPMQVASGIVLACLGSACHLRNTTTGELWYGCDFLVDPTPIQVA